MENTTPTQAHTPIADLRKDIGCIHTLTPPHPMSNICNTCGARFNDEDWTNGELLYTDTGCLLQCQTCIDKTEAELQTMKNQITTLRSEQSPYVETVRELISDRTDEFDAALSAAQKIEEEIVEILNGYDYDTSSKLDPNGRYINSYIMSL